jgi:hypothetical protein
MFGAHENLPVVGRVKPQTVTADATVTTDAIDSGDFAEVLFTFNMGDYAAGNDGEVEVKVTGDTESGGSYATDITGKALTGASFTGSSGDDAVAVIRVRRDEVGAQSLRYIRLEITPTNQNLTCSAIAHGVDSRYGPGTNFDLAAVTEIIA